jgi:hypothetical protein
VGVHVHNARQNQQAGGVYFTLGRCGRKALLDGNYSAALNSDVCRPATSRTYDSAAANDQATGHE